jgi:multicomponent K+:H+ antiporter subunit A
MRSMPRTGALALVASAAMAGVPLLNGFLSKEMFFAETVELRAHPSVEVLLPIVATLAAVFAVIYSLRFSYDIFFGPRATSLPRTPEEAPRWMRTPIELLVVSCVIVGVIPALAIGPALAAAARPVVGAELPAYSLALWHGFNLPLVMSAVAIVIGIAGYLWLRKRMKSGQLLDAPLAARLDGRWLFESALVAVTRCSRRLLRIVATPRLQTQVFAIIMVTLVLAFFASRHVPFTWGDRDRIAASPAFVLLWILGAVCAVAAAIFAKFHRLTAITLTGGAGLVTCVTFAWFSAPDLALTQIVVEVVTAALLLLGLRWMPMRHQTIRRVTMRDRARRGRDLVLAVFAGSGLAALSYALLTRPAPHSISPFFLEHALPDGGGTNVVNVMLVDFRALDTIGEITVLGAVALTVFALLRRFRPPAETVGAPEQQNVLAPDAVTDLVATRGSDDAPQGYMLVPSIIARLLLPVSLVVALHFLLRGHNEPGGGFVAGLIVAITMLAQYIVAGTRWTERRARLSPPRWIAVGLLLAALTGIAAMGFGYPFLTTHTWHTTLPVIGDVHLPSATFFDLGVFSVVIGATLLILTAIAHQSLRGHRTRQD